MIRFFAHNILITAVAVLLPLQTAMAETVRLDEYEVKAAYLYNFAKYVDWPAAALPNENTTLNFCIIGNSPMNPVIQSLAGKSVKNRKVSIREITQIEDLGGCNILFVNTAMKAQLHRILSSTVTRSILTVSDDRGFATAGGIIELMPVSEKIRFQINHRSARQSNLKISSRLLNLATTVIE